MDFPAYRRYSNGKSYFLVINLNSMVEVQIIGRYFTIHRLKAKILPERLLISDILEAGNEHIERVSSEEYHAFLEACQKEREEKLF